MRLRLRCRKCGHTWLARRVPGECPSCSSPIVGGERLGLSVEILGTEDQ
ncbi:MAG: hypothetical protein HY555_04130 [Euryarchaeota archaeon]|nr:hypothetical protein [Euryarchaeota archaeon]